jgi:hypothetical protein
VRRPRSPGCIFISRTREQLASTPEQLIRTASTELNRPALWGEVGTKTAEIAEWSWLDP